jgi:hypothetical protein
VIFCESVRLPETVLVLQYHSVTALVNEMKRSLQERQKEEKQTHARREAEMAQRMHQQYGGYQQVPAGGGYQGHYGAHVGYGGSQAGFVSGNARGY